MAYERVNGAWPEGTNDGRSIKPTGQEALAAARRLYKFGTKLVGLTPHKLSYKLTSGNRYTYPRRSTMPVNPDQRGGGWHELVHSLSHYITSRKYGDAHGPRHAFIERSMIDHVVSNGWLDGKLKRERKVKPEADKRTVQVQRVQESIAKWDSKLRRAANALKKLRQKERRLLKMVGPVPASTDRPAPRPTPKLRAKQSPVKMPEKRLTGLERTIDL
jgi:hypothetical protein